MGRGRSFCQRLLLPPPCENPPFQKSESFRCAAINPCARAPPSIRPGPAVSHLLAACTPLCPLSSKSVCVIWITFAHIAPLGLISAPRIAYYVPMEINGPILMSELFTVADPAPRLSVVRVGTDRHGRPVPVCTPQAFTDYVTAWHREDPNGDFNTAAIVTTATSVYYEDMTWTLNEDGTFTLTDWAAWQVEPTDHPAPTAMA